MRTYAVLIVNAATMPITTNPNSTLWPRMNPGASCGLRDVNDSTLVCLGFLPVEVGRHSAAHVPHSVNPQSQLPF